MTRMVSFTPEVFFALFEHYNRAIWPAQFVAYALGFIALILAFRPFPRRDRIIGAVLAAIWLWIGVVYHLLYLTQINFIAPAFAALFIIQGMLFAWTLVLRGQVVFRFRPDVFAWTGLGFAVFAMAVYPLLGWLADHGWPRSPVFGVTPCPTTIYTWGMLLLVQGRTPLHLIVIPLIWSLIGGSAAWLLVVPEEASLPLVALAGLALILWKNRLAAGTATP
ncbi:MAG: hypothetical protein GEU91_13550 [Rhizobiales bacterium]|nr:hypothetical protein [Hyphomicrobiales bacterium]